MNSPRRIICDMDDCLNRLLVSWTDGISEMYGEYVNPLDITSWEINEFYKDTTEEQIYNVLNTPNFFRNIMPMQRASYVIKSLIENGDDITIVTACTTPNIMIDKQYWLKTFMGIDKYDTCFTRKKQIIKGDIFIDDLHTNFQEFDGVRILFTAPHNKNLTPETGNYHFRCDDWYDVYDLLLGKDKAIIDAMLMA